MVAIFLSYTPADAARARAIGEALAERGLSVEWRRAPLPGQRLEDMLQQRLESAKAVVVLWSPAAGADLVLRDEANDALRLKKLVPVLIEAGGRAPLGQNQFHMTNLSDWPGPAGDAEFDTLVAALTALQAGDATAPKTFSRPPAARHFLASRGFWGWSAALGAVSGLSHFAGPAAFEAGAPLWSGRGALAVLEAAAWAFAFVAGARALLHLSRRLVGKRTAHYFDPEMRKHLLAAGLIGGAVVLLLPEFRETGLVYGANIALLVGLTVVALVVFAFRAGRRALAGGDRLA